MERLEGAEGIVAVTEMRDRLRKVERNLRQWGIGDEDSAQEETKIIPEPHPPVVHSLSSSDSFFHDSPSLGSLARETKLSAGTPIAHLMTVKEEPEVLEVEEAPFALGKTVSQLAKSGEVSAKRLSDLETQVKELTCSATPSSLSTRAREGDIANLETRVTRLEISAEPTTV